MYATKEYIDLERSQINAPSNYPFLNPKDGKENVKLHNLKASEEGLDGQNSVPLINSQKRNASRNLNIVNSQNSWVQQNQFSREFSAPKNSNFSSEIRKVGKEVHLLNRDRSRDKKNDLLRLLSVENTYSDAGTIFGGLEESH